MSTFFEDKTCIAVEDNHSNFGIRDFNTRQFFGYLKQSQIDEYQLEHNSIIKCRIKFTDDKSIQPRPLSDSESKDNIYVIEKLTSLSLSEDQIKEIKKIVYDQTKNLIENHLVMYNEHGIPVKYQFKLE